jgi:hypothetical protein
MENNSSKSKFCPKEENEENSDEIDDIITE